MLKWLLRLTISFLIIIFASGVIFTGVILYYARSLPGTETLANYQPQVMTRIHAGDGRLLAEFAAERRVFVPIESVPKRVIWAFIAAEDQDFYNHQGVDPRGIIRAGLSNLIHFGGNRRPAGGSTITQQVAKNFLLGNEVSFARKIKEVILSLRIERSMTKDHILELYLNEIYLGGGSYGVAAASMNYFSKPLDQLTIPETAFLAALPKAPNNYNPLLYPERAMERRNWVVSRMKREKIITDQEAILAMGSPLTLHQRQDDEVVRADYFAEEVRRELAARYGEDALYKGGLTVRTTLNPKLQLIAERTFRNGLIEYDMRHGYRGPLGQGTLVTAVKRLADTQPRALPSNWQVAAVTRITNNSVEIVIKDDSQVTKKGTTATIPGRINFSDLAWATNSLEDDDANAEAQRSKKPIKVSDIIRIGDIILVEKIATKSAAKGATPTLAPILANENFNLRQIPQVSGGMVAIDPHTGRTLALVGGWSYFDSQFNRATQAIRQPGSAFKPFVYLAALNNGLSPSSIVLDSPFVITQDDGTKWNPANFGEKFLGPMPMRIGIEQSRNLMTIRIAQTIGINKVAEVAENFGVVDHLPRFLAASIGAVDTTLMRMVTAYAMIVNGGKRITPSLIDRVQDHDGHTIFKHDNRPCSRCNELNANGTPPEIPDEREQVVSAVTAYQMVSMMQSVVTRGTGQIISSLRRPLAGKTGTTNDNTDNWFVGFSPDLAVGIYFGYDQPRSLGEKETGGRNAALVFRNFMYEALRNEPAIPFRIPPGIKQIRINPESGKPSNGENSIWEAYSSGTEPGSNGDSSGVVGGGDGDSDNTDQPGDLNGRY